MKTAVKITLIIVLIFSLFLGALYTTQIINEFRLDIQNLSNQQIVPNFKQLQTAVPIIVYDKGMGAGVIIKEDKDFLYVLTAKHVVRAKTKNPRFLIGCLKKDLKAITVKNIPLKNISRSRSIDLALIKVPKPKGEFRVAVISPLKEPALKGDSIYIIGHPHGFVLTVNNGIVSNYNNKIYTPYKGSTHLIISAPVHTGNSGGPVFDKQGRLVGIVVARQVRDGVRYPNLGIAVTLEEIHKFLNTVNFFKK